MKVLQIIITLVATSMFFFPFVLNVLPNVNSKMILAAMGLIALIVNLAKGKLARFDRDFLIISLLSLGVCMASYMTMTINNTPDNSYLTYIVSMWVWVGAAYLVTRMIKVVHHTLSVELVCYYLIAVGVIQCILAVVIESSPIIRHYIDGMLGGELYMSTGGGRMHGIGCALDVAGSRFAALLVMIAFLIPHEYNNQNQNKRGLLLIIAFFIITIIGSMIGRTTAVGSILGIICLTFTFTFKGQLFNGSRQTFLAHFGCIFLIIISLATIAYNSEPHWREQIRFGFEGFFSLVEKGKWEVHSNDILMDSYIFPTNIKTWIIGDGYIATTNIDPYYTGVNYSGFYKGTDVGYCRFIFYFGLIGLIAFITFITKVCQVCAKRFYEYRYMFICLYLLNLAIWLKVSTDLFLVFAPFLCINPQDDKNC